MRADQQVWILSDPKNGEILWIDPSFANLLRETGLSDSLPRKDTLAKTRAGLRVPFEVNGRSLECSMYWLQTGQSEVFKTQATPVQAKTK